MTKIDNILAIMKMNNIILLDLDGVLITTSPYESDKMHEDGYSDFNSICVTNLNRILKDTGFDIVLSSMRRTKVDIEKMNEYFKARGVEKEIIAYVPDYSLEGLRLNRRGEIERFLKENEPKNYLILDDDKSISGASEEIKSNWIQTYLMTGL